MRKKKDRDNKAINYEIKPDDLIEKFLEEVKKANPYADLEMIRKAYIFAKSGHEGQKREDGSDYFEHPLDVAKRLIKLKADSATITAALLHDIVEDTTCDMKTLEKNFGKEVANLVEGLTKISKVQFESKDDYTAQNLRKIMLATTKDIRIMMIKLCDRLHNMQTLKVLRPDKQRRIAEETLQIYAPIAHKLGMWRIKGELEDLSLKYLKPDIYQFIKGKVEVKRSKREKITNEYIRMIKSKLKEKGIEAEVYGRAKYFYSIYEKMKKKNISFDEIYDLIGIRILTSTIPDCYTALGIVHELWTPKPRRFKDYISQPKQNEYQSLHTVVKTPDKRLLEVQIRTFDMHNIAENGVAAHWKYRGTERDKKFEKKISWTKQLLDWIRTSKDAKEFIETLKMDLFKDEIVVFTPKGDPITLREGSTPVDFAYSVHTGLGHKTAKAIVNGKLVPLDYKLKPGDIVEIIPLKTASPSRQWLKFVMSSKARSKIRQMLGVESEKSKEPQKINVIEYIETGYKGQIKLSKCCNPRPYDKIVGFITKDKKLSIHKEECDHAKALKGVKEVDVNWKKGINQSSILNILVKDNVGVLADVLNIFALHKLHILSIHTREKKEQKANIQIEVASIDEDRISNLILDLKELPDVITVSKS